MATLQSQLTEARNAYHSRVVRLMEDRPDLVPFVAGAGSADELATRIQAQAGSIDPNSTRMLTSLLSSMRSSEAIEAQADQDTQRQLREQGQDPDKRGANPPVAGGFAMAAGGLSLFADAFNRPRTMEKDKKYTQIKEDLLQEREDEKKEALRAWRQTTGKNYLQKVIAVKRGRALAEIPGFGPDDEAAFLYGSLDGKQKSIDDRTREEFIAWGKTYAPKRLARYLKNEGRANALFVGQDSAIQEFKKRVEAHANARTAALLRNWKTTDPLTLSQQMADIRKQVYETELQRLGTHAPKKVTDPRYKKHLEKYLQKSLKRSQRATMGRQLTGIRGLRLAFINPQQYKALFKQFLGKIESVPIQFPTATQAINNANNAANQGKRGRRLLSRRGERVLKKFNLASNFLKRYGIGLLVSSLIVGAFVYFIFDDNGGFSLPGGGVNIKDIYAGIINCGDNISNYSFGETTRMQDMRNYYISRFAVAPMGLSGVYTDAEASAGGQQYEEYYRYDVKAFTDLWIPLCLIYQRFPPFYTGQDSKDMSDLARGAFHALPKGDPYAYAQNPPGILTSRISLRLDQRPGQDYCHAEGSWHNVDPHYHEDFFEIQLFNEGRCTPNQLTFVMTRAYAQVFYQIYGNGEKFHYLGPPEGDADFGKEVIAQVTSLLPTYRCATTKTRENCFEDMAGEYLVYPYYVDSDPITPPTDASAIGTFASDFSIGALKPFYDFAKRALFRGVDYFTNAGLTYSGVTCPNPSPTSPTAQLTTWGFNLFFTDPSMTSAQQAILTKQTYDTICLLEQAPAYIKMIGTPGTPINLVFDASSGRSGCTEISTSTYCGTAPAGSNPNQYTVFLSGFTNAGNDIYYNRFVTVHELGHVLQHLNQNIYDTFGNKIYDAKNLPQSLNCPISAAWQKQNGLDPIAECLSDFMAIYVDFRHPSNGDMPGSLVNFNTDKTLSTYYDFLFKQIFGVEFYGSRPSTEMASYAINLDNSIARNCPPPYTSTRSVGTVYADGISNGVPYGGDITCLNTLDFKVDPSVIEILKGDTIPMSGGSRPNLQCTALVAAITHGVGSDITAAGGGNAPDYAGRKIPGYTWIAYITDLLPQAGDVIIWNYGSFGHIAVVTGVEPDGSIDYAEASGGSGEVDVAHVSNGTWQGGVKGWQRKQ